MSLMRAFDHVIAHNACHFGTSSSYFQPTHHSLMDRRTLDPSWDLGYGFGAIRSNRNNWLPWERGQFSFLSGNTRTFLDEVQDRFLELPVPVAVPPPLPSSDHSALAQVFRPPRVRPAHDGWQVNRAREERQNALSKWSALLRLCLCCLHRQPQSRSARRMSGQSWRTWR